MRLKPRQLPMSRLLLMAATFWCVSVINNIVFNLGISVPLHTVCRSSSLLVSMALGLFNGKRYTVAQVGCAVAVAGGLANLNLLTAREKAVSNEDPTSLWWWLVGVGLLATSVLLSAALGTMQDAMYAQARKTVGNATLWPEALLYSHLLTIPFFFLVESPATLVKKLQALPQGLVLQVVGNVSSQFVCICGVYTLVESTSAFTMTMTITVRKFLSLLASIVYFGHYRTFTAEHWVSVVAVSIGAAVYPLLQFWKR